MSNVPESLLDCALAYASRGWHVFPIVPGIKVPTKGSTGLYDATTKEEQIKWWWARNPRYSIAINCGASGIAVYDADHGFTNENEIADYAAKHQIPRTFVVRSGRRPEWGIHWYFAGTMPTIHFNEGGVSGEVKSIGGYVLAAPSKHPSGFRYQILADRALAPLPEWIRALKRVDGDRIVDDDDRQIPLGGRHNYLTQRAVELRWVGLSGKALSKTLELLYQTRCEHDSAFDARIARGELEHIAEWAMNHPADYPLSQGDYIAFRKACDNDPLVSQAWGGQLALFENDANKAQEHLISALQKSGCHTKQIVRIGQASPLNDILEASVPDYLKKEEQP